VMADPATNPKEPSRLTVGSGGRRPGSPRAVINVL
jgi:hypothetical protein